MTAQDFSTTVVLLHSAKAGKAQALNDLLARYQPRIRQAVALSLGRMPREAAEIDDVVQEVLLAAFKNFERFELRSDGSFMGWLMTIVLNKIRDLSRHAGRQKRGSGNVRRLADLTGTTTAAEPPIIGHDPSPTSMARTHELAEAEQAAVLQLPQNRRDVIIYRDLLGMTYEEIAPLMGYKTAAPPRALHSHAREQLARILRRFDPEGGSAPNEG